MEDVISEVKVIEVLDRGVVLPWLEVNVIEPFTASESIVAPATEGRAAAPQADPSHCITCPFVVPSARDRGDPDVPSPPSGLETAREADKGDPDVPIPVRGLETVREADKGCAAVPDPVRGLDTVTEGSKLVFNNLTILVLCCA